MDMDKMKEYRLAMNGRTLLLVGGLMLIFNAISQTLVNALNMLGMVAGANDGDQEILDLLEQTGISTDLLRIVGIVFILLMVIELAAGLYAAIRCNRVDKSRFTLILLIIDLAAELIAHIFFILMGFISPVTLLSSCIVPAFLVYAATRLRKLAKMDPERVYAIQNKNKNGGFLKKKEPKGQKKSLKERANMRAAHPDNTDQE